MSTTTTLPTPPSQSSMPSRQFRPFVLYKKSGNDHQNTQSTQHDQSEEKEMAHRRLKISDMLDRNAQWWNDHETITTNASPSDGSSGSHKKGFVRVDDINETTIDDEGENDMIDMLPSISTSSTSSNSSNDSSDSISTTIATPIKSGSVMSVSTLMVMPPHTPSSPTIIPLEPKTDMPPPPLYQARRSFTIDRSPQHHQYHQHRHSTAGIYHQPISPTSISSPSLAEKSAILSSPLASPTSISSILHSNNPTTTTRSGFSSTSSSSPGAPSELLLDNVNDYYSNPQVSTDMASQLSPTLPLTKADADAGIVKKRRRGNLPKHVTEFLKYWLLQHKKHPYPTERQKLELAQRTGLAVNQISNWFINARRRILQPMLETEQLLAQQQQHLYMNHRSSLPQHPNYQHLHSTVSYPTTSTMEEKKRRQLDIYAYHGFTETTHDTQRWSVRRTKLPNIEIPEKDQHIFATVP